jgi:hypothetical protein
MDQDGNVTNRKDYIAFGEVSYTAGRTAGLGYSGAEETQSAQLSRIRNGRRGSRC